jgi:hypothetical protein
MKNKTLVYLATPYTHSDPAVVERRFNAVNRAAAQLMREGKHVFSPISHTHPIAIAGDLPTTWEFWQEYDRAVLEHCCELVILMQDGWDESKGVAGECRIATELGIPVSFLYADPFVCP